MKKYIKSAELVRYNANSSGKKSPDCVKRALSSAFDMDYNEMSKLLIEEMKRQRSDKWNVHSVYSKVLKKLDPDAKTYRTDKAITVNDFVDTMVDPSKVYILETGKRFGRSDHLLCIRDGDVWDSWDSLDQIVNTYIELSKGSSKSKTDIKVHLEDLSENLLREVVSAEIDRYAKRKGWLIKYYRVEGKPINYQCVAFAEVCINKDETVDKKRYYNFEVIVPLSPTTTLEEAQEKVRKLGKQRTYDRMWAIGEQEKKIREEFEVQKQLGDSGVKGNYSSSHYLTPQESKFISTLPGWVRPLITYVNIQYPGQYSDSYSLRIRPLPSDPIHSKDQNIEFEAWESWQIKDELIRYKDTWEIPFEDYSVAEEY